MPTLREIGIGVRISSTNGVVEHLASMEKKGWIRRTPGKTRAIQLLRPPHAITDDWLLDCARRVRDEWPEDAAELAVNEMQGWWLLTLMGPVPIGYTIDPSFRRSCWDCSSRLGHVYCWGPIPEQVWRSAVNLIVSAPAGAFDYAQAAV